MELIKIYRGNLISARELYQFLGLRKDFTSWFKSMLKYGFEEGKDFTSINYNYLGEVIKDNDLTQKGESDNQSVTKVHKRDYILTLNCAKEISMLQRSEKGKEARLYFIKCEETLQELKQNKRLEAFLKLKSTKDKLRNKIIEIGGTNQDFIQIDFSGRKVLFNGEPLPDEELPILLLKGRDFAIELTNQGFNKGLVDMSNVEELNCINHSEVREMIKKNAGTLPEEMQPEKNINKIQKGNKKELE